MVRTLGTLGIIDVFICPDFISFLSFSPFLSARLTHFPEREEVRKKSILLSWVVQKRQHTFQHLVPEYFVPVPVAVS